MIKNKKNKSLLVALSIGDGYLGVCKNSYRLYIEHTAAQFAWLDYKKKILEEIFGKSLNIHKRVRQDKRTNKVQTSYIIVKCHKYFKVLRNFIYKNGKKQCYTQQVLNWLTPEGLAIWYQDDGFLNGNLASLATYCNEEEADQIINFFKEKFDLEIRKYFHKGNNAFYHAFDLENSFKFIAMIEKYIIPEMKYKIPRSYITRAPDILKV